MDFLIDDNLLKTLKPLGFAVVGMAAIATIAIIFNKYTQQKEGRQQEEEEDLRKKPAGIYNEGNTCFVNSLLQALAPLKLLVGSLDKVLEQQELEKMSNHEVLLFELKEALKKINSESQVVDVVKFLNVVSSFSNIINLEQQDAYELFSIIMNSLEHVFNERKHISLNRSSLSTGHSNELEDTFINCSFSNNQEDKALNVLQGYTKFSIICSSCKIEQNIKIQSFYDLSLDITLNKIRTLEGAIEHFQEKQHIEGYACTKCSIESYLKQQRKVIADIKRLKPTHWQLMISIAQKIEMFLKQASQNQSDISELNCKLGGFVSSFQKQYELLGNDCKYRPLIFLQITPVLTTITKQCVISKFPKILVLHLKQLSLNPMTGQPVLLKKHINFPQQLQIPVRNGKKKYQLVSLISHTGNELQGHYFTFRRLDKQSQTWFLISDTYSTECREQTIKVHMPYMLFYEFIQ